MSTVPCDVPHHVNTRAHASDGEYTPISRKEDPQNVELPPLLAQLAPLLDNLDVVMKMLEATVLKHKLAATGRFSLKTVKKTVGKGIDAAIAPATEGFASAVREVNTHGTGQLTQRLRPLVIKAFYLAGASTSTVALAKELEPKLSVLLDMLLDMVLARAGLGQAAKLRGPAVLEQLGAKMVVVRCSVDRTLTHAGVID